MTRAERIVRQVLLARKRKTTQREATPEFRQSHTRATFGHHYTGRVVPINLDCPPEQVPFNPGWEPPLRTFEPNFKEKNVTHFWVILRVGEKEKIVRKGFKSCCKEGKGCRRKSCAKCWVAWYMKIPKGTSVVIREVPSNQKITIVDPCGVDPKGYRPRGKAMGFDERELYRITSTQRRYKGEAAEQ